MNKDLLRQIAVVLATVITLVVNTLANALPLNGLNTGAVSDSFNVYFVPAGYVFSIWGLIYVLLIAYTVYQALKSQREIEALRKIGWWYVVGSLANSIWIFMWHYQVFSLTIVFMLILLVSLIVVYLRLGIGRAAVTPAMRFLVHLPFSVYLGWITVATIANATDVISLTSWDGFGIDPKVWAVIMLVVAVAVALLMAVTRRDAAYLLVLVWAFFGIGQKFNGTAPVDIAAYVAAGAVAMLVIVSFFLKKPQISE